MEEGRERREVPKVDMALVSIVVIKIKILWLFATSNKVEICRPIVIGNKICATRSYTL